MAKFNSLEEYYQKRGILGIKTKRLSKGKIMRGIGATMNYGDPSKKRKWEKFLEKFTPEAQSRLVEEYICWIAEIIEPIDNFYGGFYVDEMDRIMDVGRYIKEHIPELSKVPLEDAMDVYYYIREYCIKGFLLNPHQQKAFESYNILLENVPGLNKELLNDSPLSANELPNSEPSDFLAETNAFVNMLKRDIEEYKSRIVYGKSTTPKTDTDNLVDMSKIDGNFQTEDTAQSPEQPNSDLEDKPYPEEE